MATWQDLYQENLNLSNDERKSIAITATNNIINYMKSIEIADEKIVQTIILIAGVFICADGKVDLEEYEFFKAFTGIECTYDNFFEAVKHAYNDDIVLATDKLIDGLSTEIKAEFVVLGISICACNGTMTVREQQILNLLID